MEKSAKKKPIKTGIITIIIGIFTILIVITAIFVGLYTYKDKNEIEETKDNVSINDEFGTIKKYMYNIIPDFTYECYGYPHLYLNVIYNDYYSIDIYGFGYTEDGKPLRELEINEHLELSEDNNYSNNNFYIAILDDYLLMADFRDNLKYCFQGDFFLVQDIIELEYDEVLDFFRDTDNIGKMFKCNLIYHDIKSDEYGDFYRLQFPDEYGYVLTIGFTPPNNNQRFFEGDIVTITGVYTPYFNDYVDIIVDGRDIEFYNR